MIELGGKRVMVVGMGVTGQAVARFLDARGAILTLTDRREDIALEAMPHAALHLGAEDPAWLGDAELVVTSPGVPRDSILLRAAVDARIPVVSEIELAARFLTAPIVAITGTNGKSTVTVMLGGIFRQAGMKTFVGGNLGTPLLDAVGRDLDVAVVEVSSFQLEWVESFKPRVGIHLNLTDDHFDRYRNLDDYGDAKARMFAKQDAGDWAILNRDDPRVWRLARELRANVLGFGLDSAGVPGIWREGNSLMFDDGRRRARIDLAGFKLPGRHNLANAMAAAAAALVMGVDSRHVERALGDFRPLAHRIEPVGERAGVTFIDDSKGTNVGSVVEAIAALKAPIVLIAGGLDKGGDYAPLRKPLKEKVKLAILIGDAREKMRSALEGATAIELAETLDEAVARAARAAAAGDTVLLSPACSSFDQFKDYAERGEIFKKLVRAL
ncbi:MAG: UDP-N-acetylmuramoyl-L-alanine--D-glutamate ligase [Candidatus Binatales bacterium]